MFGVNGGVGPLQEDTIRKCALTSFNEEFPLDADANVKAVERTDEGVCIRFVDPDRGETTETFDYVLAATGRARM